MQKLLEGVRVVELGTHIAVPKAARIMADWGADVIKVEPPRGEAWRTMGKEWGMPCEPGNNPLYHAENANKKSIAIDLKDPDGKEVLYKLLNTADVFITNMRLDPLKKLGFDYPNLKERFPALIYSQFSAYGDNGPDKDLPGFDNAAFWANSSTLLGWTVEGQEPVRPFPGFGDSICGSVILSGILGALYNRTRTGKGDYLQSSLYGSALWINSIGVVMGQEKYGREYPIAQDKIPNAFSTLYQTKDEDWIVTGTSTWNKHAPAVFKMLGLEQYLDDPAYMVLEETRSHLPEVVSLLRGGYSRISTKDALSGLKEMGLVHAKLKKPCEIENDKQAWANGYLKNVTMESGETVILPTTPVQFESMQEFPYNPGPQLGNGNMDILRELGYSDDTIQRLAESGIIKVENESEFL